MTLFTQKVYEDETFTELDCPSQPLEGITFYDCEFRGCQFNSSSFKRSRFTDCLFSNCDLSLADVTDAEFQDTRFERTALVGINWSLLATPLTREVSVDFHACTLNYATFLGLDLSKRRITECMAHELYLTEMTFVETDFGGTDFAGSTFRECDLSGADLRGAKNYAVNVLSNKVAGAQVSLPEAWGLLAGLELVFE